MSNFSCIIKDSVKISLRLDSMGGLMYIFGNLFDKDIVIAH